MTIRPTICPSGEARQFATIVLPGYLGSALRDVQTGRRIYMNLARVALRPSVLALYHAELGTPPGPEVEPDGILRDVKVLPGLITVDVYATLIGKLESLHRVVAAVGYDWRYGPYSAVQMLGATVDRLRSEGVTQIDIVAHSSGGTVAAYYLSYGTQGPEKAVLNWSGAQNIRNAVLLGAPFHGGFIMFRNLIRGISIPVIWRLFPREAVASYPSNYHLLPFSPIRLYNNLTGRPWVISALDPEFWIKWNLGLMAKRKLPEAVRSNRAAFIHEQLASAKEFGKRLQFLDIPSVPNPPTRILNVIGHGTPTEDAAYYRLSDGELSFIFNSDAPNRFGLPADKLLKDGDKNVTVESATLPDRLQSLAQTRLVHVGHEDLVTDPRVQDMVLEFLDH